MDGPNTRRRKQKERETKILAEGVSRLHIRGLVLERLLHLYTRITSLDEVRLGIVEAAVQAVPSEAGSLMLVSSEEGELTIASANGPVADKVVGMKIPPGKGIAGGCAQDGETIAVSDVTSDPRHAAEISQAIGLEARSLLATPVRHQGRIVGVIELINRKRGDDFRAHEIELIEVVARTAGNLLELAGEMK